MHILFVKKYCHAQCSIPGSLRGSSPWSILYELDLYGNKTFSNVVSGVKTWPQSNADLLTIASGVQAPGQFCTNWTYMSKKPFNRLSQAQGQTLAAKECGCIDDSLAVSSPQPTLYELDLLKNNNRNNPSLDWVRTLSGLDGTIDKEMKASENSQLNVPSQAVAR